MKKAIVIGAATMHSKEVRVTIFDGNPHAGSTAHPGGGSLMVTLSGLNVPFS
ncbi:hypothetical protein [Domibacillus indicus]|uniref:hypothetical protein n=1 Tax=Domibacillus indicus TaxID=1437523 RepID=UPI000A554B53|nr:hypothetical protein [Domibacillus indicus]